MAAFSSRAYPAFAAAALLALAAWGLRALVRTDAPAAGAETGLDLKSLLGEGAAGFAKAEGPRPFRFPADHGPHPEFRSEWWYFTGNLRDSAGREFGYQLTFFRSGLRRPARVADPGIPASLDAGADRNASPWAARDAYMAHFAFTEATAGRFHAHERFSRAALGLAGAEAVPDRAFRVWLEDWICASEAAPHAAEGVRPHGSGAESIFPLRLRASQGEVAIDLTLGRGKPMVLQGDRGYSRKGPGPGNASFYYSFTRMPSNGKVTTPDGVFTVSGSSWMDREWGSSILTPGLAGWEWFGLRLADSTEYLFFRLRKSGPSVAGGDSVAFDYGMRIDADGGSRILPASGMQAQVLSRWRSPRGRAYPARWRIRVPADSLVMEVEPALPDQELDLSIPYWEGAVRVRALKWDRPVAGDGYMELTGY